MMLSLYRTVTTLGGPLIRFYLSRRMAAGKEDRGRFGERLGLAGRERPQGKLVWVHGASVGESISLLPLIERLLEENPDWSVLVTTGTVTSASLMKERLKGRAFHQYIPVDRRAYVERFLDHWKPDLVLWAESEFWPNLVSLPPARGIPMVLINGRISPSSFKGWARVPSFIERLLRGFSLCLGQTKDDADRLRKLGARKASCIGNLKFAAPPLPVDDDKLQAFLAETGGRPRWLAASTHAGEEVAAGWVHEKLRPVHSGLLTIIVPRHPGRGVDVARTLRNSGLNVALRSARDPVLEETDIYIADTLGELGLFYRATDIVFMGKSLVPLGGQNPLEPALLDCAILMGPHMLNFAEIASKLKDANACLNVQEEMELSEAISRLLEDPEGCTRLAVSAKGVAKAEADVLDLLMEQLRPFISSSADLVSNHESA